MNLGFSLVYEAHLQNRKKEVVMTLNVGVADGQLGQYYRRTAAIAERLNKSLPFESVMSGLQLIHDGKVTSFGGGMRGRFIRTMPSMIGGVSKLALIERVRAVRELGSYAESMICHNAFETLSVEEEVLLIDLSPEDLGFTENPTTADLLNNTRLAEWSEANFDGYVVELNHVSTGPHVAIDYKNQPKGEVLWVASKPTSGSDGGPYVFTVVRYKVGESWLRDAVAGPGTRWRLDRRFLFRLRKLISVL